jgi:lipoprotein-releasing system permease protein
MAMTYTREWQLNLAIAVRFLLAKRRAMLMSLAGIVFGVAFFILTQAQTSGFERLFTDTILGTNGHIRVQDRFRPSIATLEAPGGANGAGGGFEIALSAGAARWENGIARPDTLIRQLRAFSAVTGVAQVIRERAVVTNEFRSENIQAMGIVPEEYNAVSDLATRIVHGSMRAFAEKPNGIILGAALAERLRADLGAPVFLRSAGDARRFEVVAIFRTGIDEYDKRSAFIQLAEARQLFQRREGVSYLQVTIADPAAAPALARHMAAVTEHYVSSWQERERTWLELFRVLRISSGVSMSVILLIAGLGMFNTLAIIVMERSREIAILRSMGFTRRDVAAVFLYQGMVVLVAGAALGCLLGFVLTAVIERVPIHIRGIFATNHFVVHWSAWHYFWAVVVATLMVLAASFIPARRAARSEPVQVIRGVGA